MSGFTYNYDFINLYNSSFRPSSIHTRNTGLFNYHGNYLFKKILSVIDFENLPDYWDINYFKYVLFGYGFLTVYKDPTYGVIPQNCTLSDTMTIFYQPKVCIVVNPVIRGERRLEVGKDCEILKLQPDYRSVVDIVSYYADLLSVASETAGVNLLNSKASYVFFAGDKAMAETYKKMYDKISSGEPFAILDKNLQAEEGAKNWDFFTQNVGQNYIVGSVLNDMKTIEDQFNTRVGIPNANTQKRERLISSEVEANDIDTRCLVDIWLDTLGNDLKKINEKYGLSISVKYRYDGFYNEERIGDENDGND